MHLLLLCLVSLSLAAPALSRSLQGGAAGFSERKDYYSPPHGNAGAHGGSSAHGSHGRSAGGSPPCVNPPSTGGGSGGGGLPPTAPSTGGGGHGYYNPPTSPGVVDPPVTVNPTPPYPTTPTLPYPTTPMLPDPNSPFSCNYWRTHPTAILALLGYWCPLSQIFGLPNPTVVGGSNASLMDALSNTRHDGISELYREGTAAYLNSLSAHDFYFTTQQVRDAFVAAAASGDESAAAARAMVFRRANEGHLRRH